MTTDQLIAAWRQWLEDNPDENHMHMLPKLARIATEVRRPSAQPQRRKMFGRRRG